MKKEDFSNPIDWVIYNVNGELPKQKKTSKLEKHSLPKSERKYLVKYYRNRNNRYGAFYNKKHLCMCNYEDIPHIQNYFDKHYNGNNINSISRNLKRKYNYTKKGIKPKTYSKNRLNFQEKSNGRFCARVNDRGKTHTICQCYGNERKEVSDTYDSLKKSHNIEEIKEIMKRQYNIINRKKRNGDLNNHEINITNKGAIYKDGEFIKVDSTLYDFINKYIR